MQAIFDTIQIINRK